MIYNSTIFIAIILIFPYSVLFYFFLNCPMIVPFICVSRLVATLLCYARKKTHISNISFKIIRHYRNARMTLIGHASLAMRIRAAYVSGFAECKKAPRRITPIHIARAAEGISLRKKRLLYDAYKMPLMAACERIRKGTGRPIPGVSPAKFAGVDGDRFPSRQLPARRCISGSQLTIIAGYHGVAA